MRFIICGTMIHPSVEQILPGASPAAGKYIRNMEKSLVKLGYEVAEASYVAIPDTQAAYAKLGLDDYDIVYKDKTIIKSIVQYQEKVLKMLRDGDVVIFYNIAYFEIGLIDKIRKHGNKAILILADHTDSIRENGGLIRGFLAKIISQEYRKFNYGIALSERAKRFFKAKANVIVMEGGIDFQVFDGVKPPIHSLPIKFMYSGTLSHVTGVDTLLAAMEKIDNNAIELYISGKGELSEAVKMAESKDVRIKYLGYVSDDEYYEHLEKVDVLINPRNMSLEQNQNNFPSKVLEYLAAGRLVISTKFPGWVKFIDNFEFYSGEAEDLAGTMAGIVEKCGKDYLNIFHNNREKALQYSWDTQAKKIAELISE